MVVLRPLSASFTPKQRPAPAGRKFFRSPSSGLQELGQTIAGVAEDLYTTAQNRKLQAVQTALPELQAMLYTEYSTRRRAGVWSREETLNQLNSMVDKFGQRVPESVQEQVAPTLSELKLTNTKWVENETTRRTEQQRRVAEQAHKAQQTGKFLERFSLWQREAKPGEVRDYQPWLEEANVLPNKWQLRRTVMQAQFREEDAATQYGADLAQSEWETTLALLENSDQTEVLEILSERVELIDNPIEQNRRRLQLLEAGNNITERQAARFIQQSLNQVSLNPEVDRLPKGAFVSLFSNKAEGETAYAAYNEEVDKRIVQYQRNLEKFDEQRRGPDAGPIPQEIKQEFSALVQSSHSVVEASFLSEYNPSKTYSLVRVGSEGYPHTELLQRLAQSENPVEEATTYAEALPTSERIQLAKDIENIFGVAFIDVSKELTEQQVMQAVMALPDAEFEEASQELLSTLPTDSQQGLLPFMLVEGRKRTARVEEQLEQEQSQNEYLRLGEFVESVSVEVMQNPGIIEQKKEEVNKAIIEAPMDPETRQQAYRESKEKLERAWLQGTVNRLVAADASLDAASIMSQVPSLAGEFEVYFNRAVVTAQANKSAVSFQHAQTIVADFQNYLPSLNILASQIVNLTPEDQAYVREKHSERKAALQITGETLTNLNNPKYVGDYEVEIALQTAPADLRPAIIQQYITKTNKIPTSVKNQSMQVIRQGTPEQVAETLNFLTQLPAQALANTFTEKEIADFFLVQSGDDIPALQEKMTSPVSAAIVESRRSAAQTEWQAVDQDALLSQFGWPFRWRDLDTRESSSMKDAALLSLSNMYVAQRQYGLNEEEALEATKVVAAQQWGPDLRGNSLMYMPPKATTLPALWRRQFAIVPFISSRFTRDHKWVLDSLVENYPELETPRLMADSQTTYSNPSYLVQYVGDTGMWEFLMDEDGFVRYTPIPLVKHLKINEDILRRKASGG